MSHVRGVNRVRGDLRGGRGSLKLYSDKMDRKTRCVFYHARGGRDECHGAHACYVDVHHVLLHAIAWRAQCPRRDPCLLC